MKFLPANLAGVGLILIVCAVGCGMIHTHPDCDEVARQQRSGETDEDIAKATGFSFADVQSCSETGSSGGRETAGNRQDRPQLPEIPNVPNSVGRTVIFR